MPVGGLLKGIASAENRSLVKMLPDDLQKPQGGFSALRGHRLTLNPKSALFHRSIVLKEAPIDSLTCQLSLILPVKNPMRTGVEIGCYYPATPTLKLTNPLIEGRRLRHDRDVL